MLLCCCFYTFNFVPVKQTSYSELINELQADFATLDEARLVVFPSFWYLCQAEQSSGCFQLYIEQTTVRVVLIFSSKLLASQ